MQSTIKIVHVKYDPYDLYIGRANKYLGLPESKWMNPFPMKNESERQMVIDKFEEYLLSRPDLMDALHELDGKVLACWCKPRCCHGDILKKHRELQINGQ